jgi:hypothetical protein
LEKSANPQALERIPRFGEKKPGYSVLAPSRFLAKSLQILGNLQAHPGQRACFGKGRWRRKGNRESNLLWALFSRIFNAFLTTKHFQDDADLVLGEMVLARGAKDIADKLIG